MPIPKPKPKPVGRPKLHKDHVKSTTLLVRLNAEDRKGVDEAAKATGQTVSEWLRATIHSAIHG